MDAKGAKRSVKMSTTSFYKSFFKKYVGIHEQSAVSKIRSVHTYVMHRTVFFVESVAVFSFDKTMNSVSHIQLLKFIVGSYFKLGS